MNYAYAMSWGAQMVEGGVRFRLWAPDAREVMLLLEGTGTERAMLRAAGGWSEWTEPEARAGTRYRYRIDGNLVVPDPASRFQPDGVHGHSMVVDPRAFEWPQEQREVAPINELVFYELHVGAFTDEGTYAAAAAHLPELARLGVTAIELMPVAERPGMRNWGYDGVLLYAPCSAYGTPEELKAFIVEAHRCGLAVVLDVVYNHFGPEGNYLYAYASRAFTTQRKTPWGAAIAYDDPENEAIRRYAIDNALYWLCEYRFDGLRLDATQAIVEDGPRPILRALLQDVRRGAGRRVHLIVENDSNRVDLLREGYDGHWNDDAHHAMHMIATGEHDGYYREFAEEPVAMLARALTAGMRPFGDATAGVPLGAFVNALQNHDQIGNRAFGERIGALAPDERILALTAILLLAPSPPLLFMGEEWHASTPFLYFSAFGGELGRAVCEGRRDEFRAFAAFADSASRERIPDPEARATFEASRLRWDERDEPEHRVWIDRFSRLLALRRSEIVWRTGALTPERAAFDLYGRRAFEARWRLDDGALLRLEANLADEPQPAIARDAAGALLFATHDAPYAAGAPAWSVRWSIA